MKRGPKRGDDIRENGILWNSRKCEELHYFTLAKVQRGNSCQPKCEGARRYCERRGWGGGAGRGKEPGKYEPCRKPEPITEQGVCKIIGSEKIYNILYYQKCRGKSCLGRWKPEVEQSKGFGMFIPNLLSPNY